MIPDSRNVRTWARASRSAPCLMSVTAPRGAPAERQGMPAARRVGLLRPDLGLGVRGRVSRSARTPSSGSGGHSWMLAVQGQADLLRHVASGQTLHGGVRAAGRSSRPNGPYAPSTESSWSVRVAGSSTSKRAPGAGVGDHDAAAVRLDDLAHDGESEAGAPPGRSGSSRRAKRSKTAALVGRDPGTSSLTAPPHRHGGDSNATSSGRGVRHCRPGCAPRGAARYPGHPAGVTRAGRRRCR